MKEIAFNKWIMIIVNISLVSNEINYINITEELWEKQKEDYVVMKRNYRLILKYIDWIFGIFEDRTKKSFLGTI